MSEPVNPVTQTANFEFAALNEAVNYRHALVRDFNTYLYGNVLEVGAGVGQITAELQGIEKINRLCAIEPDADFCEQFRAQFPHVELIGEPLAICQWIQIGMPSSA